MYTLLFIEDDDHIRLALSMALEDEGYDVTQAANGSSGLALFDEREFDLVLLDLRLPDLSGFDVCRSLRAKSIAPIIVVTAQTDTHDLVAGLEAGADDYVTKPVVAKELAARIRAHLRRVQLHEQPIAKAERFGDVELRRGGRFGGRRDPKRLGDGRELLGRHRVVVDHGLGVGPHLLARRALQRQLGRPNLVKVALRRRGGEKRVRLLGRGRSPQRRHDRQT